MKKIMILTGDMIGNRMAGPAIRAFEMARVLSATHSITLACPEITGTIPDLPPTVHVTAFGVDPRWSELDACDAVIIPGSMHVDAHFNTPMLVDLYDPFILSSLSRTDKTESKQLEELESLKRNLSRGDFFVCASDRQKDFWLGMLAASGRVNIRQYKTQPHLQDLIQTAPFGIPEEPPCGKKWNFPGDPGDFWIVWGGGIWDWFDPLTPIRAVAELNKKGKNISLLFMGTTHPNPRMTQMSMAQKAIDLAEELQILNRKVFFSDWIPYSDRGSVLQHANLAVSTHYPHLETHFSYRTRILDYIWARLPFVCTVGDVFSDIARQHQIGLTVPPENMPALAEAFETFLCDPEYHQKCRANLQKVADEMTWPKVLKPVLDFCNVPRRAPDILRSRPASLNDDGIYSDGCETAVIPAGEILAPGIKQDIVCREGALCRIDLKLATFNRVNTGYGVFEILDTSGTERVSIPFDLATVEDNLWRSFRFGPLPSIPGSRWSFKLSCPRSYPGNAITIWVDNTILKSCYTLNDSQNTGSVNYRVYVSKYEGSERELRWKNAEGFRFPFWRKR
jgi:glycosyltransferase involved in cell wall biosynthesis